MAPAIAGTLKPKPVMKAAKAATANQIEWLSSYQVCSHNIYYGKL